MSMKRDRPAVYQVGGRVYDSVNGVTCHQCRYGKKGGSWVKQTEEGVTATQGSKIGRKGTRARWRKFKR